MKTMDNGKKRPAVSRYGFHDLYIGIGCIYTDDNREIWEQKVVVCYITKHIVKLECIEGKKKGMTWTPCDTEILLGKSILTAY